MIICSQAKKNEWEAYRNPTDDFESMGERDMNTFLSLTEESEVLDLKEAFEVAKVKLCYQRIVY